MATVLQKITLNGSRDIPFNKLALSQANVRRVKSGLSIEELAADIERRGLLQSLNVRPVLDAGGVETGMFEIPAGGRRFRALELLVKQKKLFKTAPIPCIVQDANSPIPAEEDSLAENVRRVDLHPLDQFRAFRALLEKGQSEEEIAARFFVTPAVVKQRLRLITVSEKLLSLYSEDEIRLDQLVAFSISDDHARQEQVWEILSRGHNRDAYLIRRMLTEKTVRASDRRVRFVGIDAYVAAGGHVLRDLFQADDGGWLDDPMLLDRLVMEKLAGAAEEIRTEGWKWVETALSFPWGHTRDFGEIDEIPVALSEDNAARLEALRVERETIEAEYAQADELPDEIDARLGEIEGQIAAIEERAASYDPVGIAYAGVFVSLGNDGTLLVERGFVRPEDMPTEPEDDDAGIDGDDSARYSEDDEAVGAELEEEDGLKPLSDRLLTELTAWRTLALRDAFAANPHAALTELLHTLVREHYWHVSRAGCLQIVVVEATLSVHSSDMPGSLPANAVRRRGAEWKNDLPEDEDALWHWLDQLDETSRLALLAHCLSLGVNALYERAAPHGRLSQRTIDDRQARADRLATALRLDLAEAGWRPTVDNYLGRVTKARILQAVREARGDEAADRIVHLKKAEMAEAAERLLEGSGWLPETLRTKGLPAQAEADPIPDGVADGPAAVAAE